jgi:hypothetical protein
MQRDEMQRAGQHSPPGGWPSGIYLSIIPAWTRDTLTETRTHGFGLVAICGTLGAVVDAQRDIRRVEHPRSPRHRRQLPRAHPQHLPDLAPRHRPTSRPQANLTTRRTLVTRSPNTLKQVGVSVSYAASQQTCV